MSSRYGPPNSGLLTSSAKTNHRAANLRSSEGIRAIHLRSGARPTQSYRTNAGCCGRRMGKTRQPGTALDPRGCCVPGLSRWWPRRDRCEPSREQRASIRQAQHRAALHIRTPIGSSSFSLDPIPSAPTAAAAVVSYLTRFRIEERWIGQPQRRAQDLPFGRRAPLGDETNSLCRLRAPC